MRTAREGVQAGVPEIFPGDNPVGDAVAIGDDIFRADKDLDGSRIGVDRAFVEVGYQKAVFNVSYLFADTDIFIFVAFRSNMIISKL